MKTNTLIIPIIRKDNIARMLETLHKYTEDYYVIVIDQTTDNDAFLENHFKTHLWIRSYRNLGFSKAMNTGIKLAQTEYITLANDDIEFMDSRWFQGVLDTFASDPHIAAVNPMSPKEGAWGYGLRADNKDTWQPPKGFGLFEDGIVPLKKDGSLFVYKKEFTKEDYDFLLNEHPTWSKGSMCDAIAMWCTVFKKTALEKLGLLDERFYPGGGEDYDMNARAYSCAYPFSREDCNPEFHQRMVGSAKSWVWHHWGRSKDAISGVDPSNKLFASRPRWNQNEELWKNGFDVWGHKNDGDKKIPLKRVPDIFIDEL